MLQNAVKTLYALRLKYFTCLNSIIAYSEYDLIQVKEI